ncbi:GtrA family protein [Lujinxingia vulgaris]|uniref:GtrA family protein n=1 Tax=Lujinxingia vulgaris TaxID=2600176 RepID=A0A5C6X7Q9_9DELT|nr:GtrA family protein [Lujinxingia vulgaris]TXD32471.1 GtrA family protein [Lujinxingia vulgaris]
MTIEPLDISTELELARPAPERWRARVTRLVIFGVVGLSGVGVNLAVFKVFFHLIVPATLSEDLRFVLANLAGVIVSIFTNFLLNDRFTWGDRLKGDRRDWYRRLTRYYVAASGAGAVQMITAWASLPLWVMLGWQLAGYKLAPTLGVLTGIGCGMALNFLASHFWAFRDADSPS